ncbi:glycosyltransferase family 2 protein [Simkania negevensis]|uniref:Glycosyltransferase family 2 protein n=1 Tax=Simkania negevensis TaxID=83561 RepID=A0ABS3AR89_9BACT|nr:glycosyltransferase family 2 protein [Simkania negevensis]
MPQQAKKSVGIAVITHRAKQHLAHCLPPLLNSPLKPRLLVVNSSSNDGTVEEAKRLGADVLVIPRKEFNHGATRERARKELATDIAVMMTPDAYALDTSLIERLITPLLKEQASLAYARQIPHDNRGFFESFPRLFNYPDTSHIRGIEDVEKYGVYTFFCSDTCSAYLNSALDDIGGFLPVLSAEDAFAAASLIKKGHKIAYVAEAVVKHSHNYSLVQEFQRHFDTGYVRKQYSDLLDFGVTDEARGKQYVKTLFGKTLKTCPWKLPYAALTIAAKYAGYQAGKRAFNAPLWLKKKLSSQDFYWSSAAFLQK